MMFDHAQHVKHMGINSQSSQHDAIHGNIFLFVVQLKSRAILSIWVAPKIMYILADCKLKPVFFSRQPITAVNISRSSLHTSTVKDSIATLPRT